MSESSILKCFLMSPSTVLKPRPGSVARRYGFASIVAAAFSPHAAHAASAMRGEPPMEIMYTVNSERALFAASASIVRCRASDTDGFMSSMRSCHFAPYSAHIRSAVFGPMPFAMEAT